MTNAKHLKYKDFLTIRSYIFVVHYNEIKKYVTNKIIILTVQRYFTG